MTFQRTKEYTTITDLLRLLHDVLVKITETWESFEKGDVQYFEVEEHQGLRKTWDSNLASINKDVSELRYLRRSLLQRIEMFDNKRSAVSAANTYDLSIGSLSPGRSDCQCIGDGRDSGSHSTRERYRKAHKGDYSRLKKTLFREHSSD